MKITKEILENKKNYIEKQFKSYSRKYLLKPSRQNRDNALSYLHKLELINELLK